MLVVSPINNINVKPINQRKSNPRFAYEKDSISFQGKKIQPAKKTFWSIIAAPFAGLFNNSEIKSKKEQEGIEKERLNRACSAVTDLRLELDMHEIADLAKSYCDNPDLTRVLLERKSSLNNSYYYTPTAVNAIVKWNKEDPKLAYHLTHILAKTNVSESEIDYIANTLKISPELVTKFSNYSVESLCEILKAYQKDPEFVDKACKYVSPYSLNALIETRKIYRDEIDELSIRDDRKLYLADILNFAPKYKENKEKIEELIKLTSGSENCSKLLDIYAKYPDGVRHYWKNMSPKEVALMAEAHETANEYFELGKNYVHTSNPFDKGRVLENYIDAAKFALDMKKYEGLFKQIREKNPNIQLDNVKELKLVLDVLKSENNIEYFQKMIDEGNCSTLRRICDFCDDYKLRKLFKF